MFFFFICFFSGNSLVKRQKLVAVMDIPIWCITRLKRSVKGENIELLWNLNIGDSTWIYVELSKLRKCSWVLLVSYLSLSIFNKAYIGYRHMKHHHQYSCFRFSDALTEKKHSFHDRYRVKKYRYKLQI